MSGEVAPNRPDCVQLRNEANYHRNRLLILIEKRLGALEKKLEAAVDRELTGQVRRALEIARVDPAFVLAKARYMLEVIIHDIYRRELPEAKPKPLFNMIEVLAERPGLFDRKTLADIHYIRINGNLLVRVQDEPPMISEGDVEQIMLMTANLVDWYLLHYQPAQKEGRTALMPDLPIPPKPYRGLEAFGEADSANYFFLVTQLRLRDPSNEAPFHEASARTADSRSGASSTESKTWLQRIDRQIKWLGRITRRPTFGLFARPTRNLLGTPISATYSGACANLRLYLQFAYAHHLERRQTTSESQITWA